MNAVLRVWWTLFTALPLQRWLGGIGAALCALLAAGGLLAQQPLWVVGLLVLFILTVFPTLFASAAVFRALSAPRANQLLPHFRVRMLGAVLLLLATLLAIFALFLSGPSPAGRGLPLEQTGYAFAFATALFLWMFILFGEWRWIWLWIAIPIALRALDAASTAQALLAALPAWAWPTAAAAGWIVFAVWYLRVRRIAPLMLVPQPPAGRWSRAALGETLTRDRALRVLLNAELPRSRPPLFAGMVGVIVVAVLVTIFVLPAARFFPFTSFVWPFSMMLLLWGTATAVVHKSRLLWLRLPGPRDVMRREIEWTLLRNAGRVLLLLLGAAAFYASPLVAAPPQQVLAGFTVAACAGVFGTYLALAAVPGGAIHLTSFGLMMALQLALLARPSPSLAAVGIVAIAEVAGAIAFRALALRRWQHIDWLRVRLIPQASMLRNW